MEAIMTCLAPQCSRRLDELRASGSASSYC
jgi:hypothetical protein